MLKRGVPTNPVSFLSIMKRVFFILLALIICLPAFSRSNEKDKQADVKYYYDSVFQKKLANISPDAQKDSVVAIMGAPYKQGFIKTVNDHLYERLSYKVYVTRKSGITLNELIYDFIFKDSKLIIMNDTELISGGEQLRINGHIDLWDVAKSYGDVK